MTKLITLDEVLLDDIVGLLDFNGSLTPRLSTGDGDALTAALFSDNTGPASPSTGSDDSAKPNKQSRKREREKTRQRRYRQRIRDSRDELQRQVGELSKELLQLIKVAVMRKEMQMSTDILKNTSQWVSETVRQQTTINSTHRRKADGEVAYFQHVNKVVLPFSFHKRFVSRCYKEENRLVLVWKMSSEGQGDFRGLHAEETAWMSVRGTPTGVMMEVCVQQVPMRFNKGTSHEPATAMFHNVLHESLEADKNEMLRNLERLLLDDVLNGIEC
ncbi:hypothetical protein PC119_g11182 [Phytophthora cactorum]|uniref:BZIP domain-containing protein n=1 Tax=Phytophthora cactorum TaxID=29920 RepID=A0A8T0Z799_9STRA|nr:hypothetical protein PC113_g10113 [Phytophthora cactorum]KAG3016986.1 hypothetical protein PC119_g11182 [Phytophthora cactorum]